MSIEHGTYSQQIGRAVEDLRHAHIALKMATNGIAADLQANNEPAISEGVYFLLMTVAEKIDLHLSKVEALVHRG